MSLQTSDHKTVPESNTNSISSVTPNPFSKETVIRLFIADDIHDARLMVTDSNGKVIKEMEITNRAETIVLLDAIFHSRGLLLCLLTDGEKSEVIKLVA